VGTLLSPGVIDLPWPHGSSCRHVDVCDAHAHARVSSPPCFFADAAGAPGSSGGGAAGEGPAQAHPGEGLASHDHQPSLTSLPPAAMLMPPGSTSP
jgi:hypothetical protein